MKIATWNVNSVNVRLPNILKYLKDYQPDILCLQELKCTEDKYPLDDLLGRRLSFYTGLSKNIQWCFYYLEISRQKTAITIQWLINER